MVEKVENRQAYIIGSVIQVSTDNMKFRVGLS